MEKKKQINAHLVMLIFIALALGIGFLQPFHAIGASLGPGWADLLNGGIAFALLIIGAVVVMTMRLLSRNNAKP